MGVLETQRLVAVVSAGEEDDGACGRGVLIRFASAENNVAGSIPGTSSVSGSLRIPKFHLRRGASVSGLAVAVELAPLSSFCCVLRHGVSLTMVGCRPLWTWCPLLGRDKQEWRRKGQQNRVYQARKKKKKKTRGRGKNK